MSIGLEKIASDLVPADRHMDGEPRRFRARLELWEDLLTLLVDPESAKVEDRAARRLVLSRLLER
ncbi:MAG: hypothetical protein HY076_01640, partial [Candidatus Eisenbacteria bacterium]|nr:hypothetical protein [Candidatus Eisenbacteria bacterium]